MYTEIVKIIEGGLKKDSNRVYKYAEHLASKLHENGDDKLAKRIFKVLNGIQGSPVYKEELFSAPVDGETRLDIATVIFPKEIDIKISLNERLKRKLDKFVKSANSKDLLIKNGIEVNMSTLLYGPPGSGKTSIAYYLAKELDLPLVIARFDSLISSLLGSTSKNIRRLFDFANSKPCILFLDEFDAIGKARNDNQEMGELKRVINSLLQNIDEFTKENILIAATNHQELLDKAIWRRFDSVIEVGLPEKKELKELIKFFLIKDSLLDPKRLEVLSNILLGFSPSEIKKIINKAKLTSVLSGKEFDYESLLVESFNYKTNNRSDLIEAVKFLNENGVSQTNIANRFDISMRQVRNLLNQ